MGIACSLNKDKNGNVISATTSSGEKSILFEEALKISDQAVDIYALADTPTFKSEVEQPLKEAHKAKIQSRLNSDVRVNQSSNVITDASNGAKLKLKSFRDGVTVSNTSGDASQGIYISAIKSAIDQDQSFYLNPGEEITNTVQSLGITVQDGKKIKIPAFPSEFYSNGEPTVETVLGFLDRKNTPESLDEFEQAEVKVAMTYTNLKNSDELLRALRTGFPTSGATRQTLSQAGIYTSGEIKNILENSAIEKQIQKLIQKLSNSETSIDNDIYLEDTFRTTSVFDTNVIGKVTEDNPFLNEQDALQQIGGYKTTEQYDAALEESDLEYLKDNGQYMFGEFSQYNRIPVKQIINGVLTDRRVTETLETLEATLQYPTNTALQERINGLQVSESIWETSPEEITTLLRALNFEATNIALDLTTLQDLYDVKSYSEFQGLLVEMNNLFINPTQENLESFARIYDEFFDNDLNAAVEVRKVDYHFRDKSLISLDTNQTAYETFEQFGILPVQDTVYQKTDALRQDLESTYNKIYELERLPREAYGSVAIDKNGEFNRQKYLANKEQVIQNMKNWVRSQTNQIEVPQDFNSEILEKMVLYSRHFGNPLNNSKPVPTPEEFYTQSQMQIDPTQYRINMLKEKNKNSLAYKEFYNNFADPISLALKQPYIKEQNIDMDDYIVDDNLLRDYYNTYPIAVPMFTGVYQNLQDNLILAQSKRPFIRINTEGYELVQNKGNSSFYSPLSQEIPQVNLDAYNYLIDSHQPETELKKTNTNILNC